MHGDQHGDAELLQKTVYLHFVQCDKNYTRLYLVTHTHTRLLKESAVFLGIRLAAWPLQHNNPFKPVDEMA